jgi:hypothetical protein
MEVHVETRIEQRNQSASSRLGHLSTIQPGPKVAASQLVDREMFAVSVEDAVSNRGAPRSARRPCKIA